MAQALHMDTLEASDTLQSVGFEKKQADTLIRIVNAQRQDIDLSHLATKEDLAREIADVKGEIADVKSDMDQRFSDMDKRFAIMTNELKWIKGYGAAIIALIVIPMIGNYLGIG